MKRIVCMLAAVCLAGAVGLAPAPAAAGSLRLESYPIGAERVGEVATALAPLVPEDTRLSTLGGALLVVGDDRAHAIVSRLIEQTFGAPLQYEVTVVQGVSRAEAQAMVRGDGSDRVSLRGRATGPETVSLRVSAGEPATLEQGQLARVLDSVWAEWGGGGAVASDIALTRGFTVTVTPAGPRVALRLESFRERREPVHNAERAVESVGTRMVVTPGRWVILSTAGEHRPDAGRTVGTRTAFEPVHTLVRVVALPR